MDCTGFKCPAYCCEVLTAMVHCVHFNMKINSCLLNAQAELLNNLPSDLKCSKCNSGLCWTVFARNRDTAVPAEGNGDLQTLIGVFVARPWRCPTLSNPVPWQNWMAAYLGYTLRMKTLFRGWPVMVHDTHTRRSYTLLIYAFTGSIACSGDMMFSPFCIVCPEACSTAHQSNKLDNWDGLIFLNINITCLFWNLITPPRRIHAMLRSVIRSFGHSVCKQDNSQVRLWTSIKHGRHRQAVTLWKLLIFAVDPDRDVDYDHIPLPLTLGRYGINVCRYDVFRLIRGRHHAFLKQCSDAVADNAVALVEFELSEHLYLWSCLLTDVVCVVWNCVANWQVVHRWLPSIWTVMTIMMMMMTGADRSGLIRRSQALVASQAPSSQFYSWLPSSLSL